MSTPDPRALRARNLRTLAALAALFLAPLAIAFFTYYGTGWRPARLVNHGVLYTPARPLPQVELAAIRLPGAGADDAARAQQPFHGLWSLVYVGAGGCDADCRAALYAMRQTRLLLNNDMGRVARVWLVTGDCCAREFVAHEHPGLLLLDAQSAAAAPLLAAFPAQDRASSLYIVDPLGNLVMSYDARQDPHGLLADLKKLLGLSNIG
jgi:hypothetical protein